jgi:hypothetical protein
VLVGLEKSMRYELRSKSLLILRCAIKKLKKLDTKVNSLTASYLRENSYVLSVVESRMKQSSMRFERSINYALESPIPISSKYCVTVDFDPTR